MFVHRWNKRILNRDVFLEQGAGFWSIRHLLEVLDLIICQLGNSKGSEVQASSSGNLRNYFSSMEILQSPRASLSSHLDKVQSTNQEVLTSVNFDLSQMDEPSKQEVPTAIKLDTNPQMYHEVPSSVDTQTIPLFSGFASVLAIYREPPQEPYATLLTDLYPLTMILARWAAVLQPLPAFHPNIVSTPVEIGNGR